MNKAISIALTCLIAATSLQANSFKNGDFESGSTGWKGDRKVRFETEKEANKVCEVIIKSKAQTFEQKVKVDENSTLNLTFRVKSIEGLGAHDYSVHFITTEGNYTFFDSKAKNGEWEDVELNYRPRPGSQIELIKFIVMRGKQGSVLFDDFKLIEK